jgi:hypothetical protein
MEDIMDLLYEVKLASEFHFMRSRSDTNQNERIDDLYGAFGCECSNGWYDVLHGLCTEITSAYSERGIDVDVIPEQIKEKFGTLRFYFSCGMEMYETVNDIVSKWETISGKTCELCGDSGSLRTDRSWWSTLCDECNKKR